FYRRRGTSAPERRRVLAQHDAEVVVGLPALRIETQDRLERLNGFLQTILLLQREGDLLPHVHIVRSALEHGSELFERGAGVALPSQRDTEVHTKLRIGAVESDCSFECGDGLLHVAGLSERRTQVVPGANKIRLQLHRLPEFSGGVDEEVLLKPKDT